MVFLGRRWNWVFVGGNFREEVLQVSRKQAGSRQEEGKILLTRSANPRSTSTPSFFAAAGALTAPCRRPPPSSPPRHIPTFFLRLRIPRDPRIGNSTNWTCPEARNELEFCADVGVHASTFIGNFTAGILAPPNLSNPSRDNKNYVKYAKL